MTLATSLRATAKRLLRTLGEATQLTFKRYVQGNYNPSTGSHINSSYEGYTGYGWPDEYKAMNDEDDSLVERGSIKLWFYSDNERPKIGDVFTIDDVEYKAMEIETMTVQGVDALYIVRLEL